MNYHIAIAEEHDQTLFHHLIRMDEQEDLCFVLYNLSSGNSRNTAIIKELILPYDNERMLHGNVSFTAAYFERVSSLALKKKCGIGFIHCHYANGWQSMSRDDIDAEKMLAPRVKAITGLPLFGLTLSRDRFWSARTWIKEGPKNYVRHDCKSIRVVGKGLRLSINEQCYPKLSFDEAFSRTISAWGEQKQAVISRLKICIVGLGSVGSIVAEALVKTGFRDITLLDFDVVKKKNLDRLNGIGFSSIGKFKVLAIGKYLEEVSATTELKIDMLTWSIIEKEGLKAALDADVIFSCVDRPWPRYILNVISYANLIPVIDGGIDSSANRRGDNLEQARWKAHAVNPGRRCLCCLGQYAPEDVALEQSGLLEDPHYIKNLPKDHFIHRGENVYAFSLGLAGMEMQQLLSLLLQPRGQYCGPKEYNFNSGTIDSDFEFNCKPDCEYSNDMFATGDKTNNYIFTEHQFAKDGRAAVVNALEPIQKRRSLHLKALLIWLKKKVLGR